VTDPAGDAATDPVGVMVTLIAGAKPGLDRDAIQAVVTAVAGGRAKQRRLAQSRGMVRGTAPVELAQF
jgi:hypothetical protein